MKVKHYQIHCGTDSQWEDWFLPEGDPAPTTCPVDTAHTVTADSVSVVETIGDDFARTEDGSLKTTDRPATEAYEMCDRDILIRTATFDTRAGALVSGVDTDGHIYYVSTCPGTRGNTFTVEHSAGATGVGNEDRALAATLSMGLTQDLLVVFGTDSNGDSVVPAAGAIASYLGTRLDILMMIAPTLPGSGASLSAVQAKTALAGGLSPSLEDIKINPTTYTKDAWSELQQVGVFKEVAGDYVECDDQADADTESCLSIWRYCAHDQQTGLPTIIEIRDGFLVVDAALNDSLEHQAYAIGAPQIPASFGGQVVQFDAYLKYYKGKQLGATSPQAKALDPFGPGGMAAAELRVYVYYPKGTQNDHILRLVTYRPPGTF